MAWKKSPPDLIESFLAALPDRPRMKTRWMFGYPAAFVNGNMFAGLHRNDVIVRLPETQRELLLHEGGRRWEPMPGRVMNEYLLLPAGFAPATLRRWLKRSFSYAASLPKRQQKKPRPLRKRENRK